MQTKNKRSILNAWASYDMANSVYSLCIATAIFPPFYEGLTSLKDKNGALINDAVSFFGWVLPNTVLYSYALSFAFLVIAFLAPVLSGIADYSGNKKSFMKFFVYLGALSCAALYFFEPATEKIFPVRVELPIIAFITATIGFSGSLVFYNSFLPEIATPDRFEKISARGFAMGYGGSVFLLVANLMMIQKPEWFGLTNSAEAARISFLTVGFWWAGLSQIAFYHLPAGNKKTTLNSNALSSGFSELRKVFIELKNLPALRIFLLAFFFLSMGLQTVLYVASIFGKKVLDLETSKLIVTVLLIQIVAIPGSYFFAYAANKKGNILTLSAGSLVWIGICVAAYFTYTEYQFYALAGVVGWVMGGVQSLCRATYSRLLPRAHDTAAFYIFLDATEKFGVVLGTFIYGFIEGVSGNMRNSILGLIVFFVLATISLFNINMKNKRIAQTAM